MNQSPSAASIVERPFMVRWDAWGRFLVFMLAATSIWCLLAEFYGLCSMRIFAIWIFVPATLLLIALAAMDAARGRGDVARAVAIGTAGGLLAAFAYDVFRLPFVFSNQWHLGAIFPSMPLFKVFPRFGAMLLGQPLEQATYSSGAQLLGWAYHFSNGATFGIMFLALVGKVKGSNWAWAIAMAAGLELSMLLTPYPRFFGIRVTTHFVIVTLSAHAIFGVMLGLSSLWMSRVKHET